MANGVSIRYMIPEFNERAGFSPSWPAVFVQIEHWALTTVIVEATIIMRRINILLHFFIKKGF